MNKRMQRRLAKSIVPQLKMDGLCYEGIAERATTKNVAALLENKQRVPVDVMSLWARWLLIKSELSAEQVDELAELVTDPSDARNVLVNAPSDRLSTSAVDALVAQAKELSMCAVEVLVSCFADNLSDKNVNELVVAVTRFWGAVRVLTSAPNGRLSPANIRMLVETLVNDNEPEETSLKSFGAASVLVHAPDDRLEETGSTGVLVELVVDKDAAKWVLKSAPDGRLSAENKARLRSVASGD